MCSIINIFIKAKVDVFNGNTKKRVESYKIPPEFTFLYQS
jgi:hypothetical protein